MLFIFIEDALKANGATYSKIEEIGSLTVEDGLLITGQTSFV
jgi:hypothetical protein